MNVPPRARREMRRDLRYPDDWSPVPFTRRFTASEFERMAAGLIATDMDEKWFVYLDDDTFYFHRDWTGLCVFRVRLQRAGEDFEVAEAAIGLYPPTPSPWWRFWDRPQQDRKLHPAWVTSESTELLGLIVDVGLLGRPDPRLL